MTTDRLLAAVAAAAILLAAPRVHADDADNRLQAKAAFARAEAAEHRKDWRAAIAEYEHAYDLSPHPFALFNIAANFERLEELRQAATYYRRYLDESPGGDDHARVERLIDGLRKRASQVRIVTEPSGADVVVDDRPAGRSPAELSLPGGAHHVVVTTAAARADRTIDVAYGEPLSLSIDLVARVGTLEVASNRAGAQVNIDGEPAGVTPLRREIAAGDHRVEVSAFGYGTVERQAAVPADGTAQITVNLIKLPPAIPLAGTTAPKTPRYYFSFDGGGYVDDGGGRYVFGFGTRGLGGHLDAAVLIGFATGPTAYYAVGARAFPILGHVRPYASATAGRVTADVPGWLLELHGGVMIAELSAGAARYDIFVESGVSFVVGDTSTMAIPIIVGIDLLYSRP